MKQIIYFFLFLLTGCNAIGAIPQSTASKIPLPNKQVLTPSESKSVDNDNARVYHITLNPDPNFDNTASLQAQLDAIPDGKLLSGNGDILEVVGSGNGWSFKELEPEIKYVDIYFPKGRYWTEGASWKAIDPENSKKTEGSWVVILRNRKYLRLHAEGTTLYTKAPGIKYDWSEEYPDWSINSYIFKGLYSHRRHLIIKGSENIIVNGLTIEGSNYTEGKLLGRSPEHTPPFWKEGVTIGGSLPGYPGYINHYEFEHGIAIDKSTNIRLKDVDVKYVWGDGIYTYNSRNIVIKDSKVEFNGRMSFATAGGSNILLDGFHANYSRMSGIDFENDHSESVIEYVEVKNSKLEFIQLLGIPAEGVGDVSNIYIHDNDLGWEAITCIAKPKDLLLRKNWRIHDNLNVENIKFIYTDNISINRNLIDTKYPWPIRVTAARDFEAVGNTFVRGNGIRTAMSGAAAYEPYSKERWEVRNNIPPANVLDESEVSTKEGILLYEEIKKLNPQDQ